MSAEPENLVLQVLRHIRGDIAEVKAEVAKVDAKSDRTKAEFEARLVSEINSLRADVDSDALILRKQMSEQFAGLHHAVVDYHSAVVGHGFLITDLEPRMQRVERHLDLPPLDVR